MNTEYLTNLGKIVLAMASHDVENWGDCSINDPIMNLYGSRRPAHAVILPLAALLEEHAAGIVGQLDWN